MAPKHLSVVQGEGAATVEGADDQAEVLDVGQGSGTVADRVRRLQEEARMLAREEIESFERHLAKSAQMAAEIAEGGDAYPVGIRAMAEQLSEELPQRVQSLKAIMERIRRG